MTELATSGCSIVAHTLYPCELPAHERDECFALLAEHFVGVSRQQFERDLSEKNVILTLRDAASGRLTGFSTMLIYETLVAGSPISLVCSGDTIVDPSAWNSPSLPREWIAAVYRLRREYPRGPYLWLLITSGYRTYRLLSTFWQRFVPQVGADVESTSPLLNRELLHTLCAERFGSRFDRHDGIVRFAQPQRLRPHLAGIPPQRLLDPHVAFFASANPNHAAGDELACLCDLDPSNLTRAGRRMVFGPGGGPSATAAP